MAKANFDVMKSYVHEMNLVIVDENREEELVVVENEEEGIKNLIIDCEPPIVVIEQLIMKLKSPTPGAFYKRLLQMNRELVHGAFVLDESGDMLLFRDTLQLENMDYNELEGSIKSLSLALSEYGAELIPYAAS